MKFKYWKAITIIMIRSIFTSNQVSGSIAFVSTIIVLLILPPITVESSFAILFLGALISVIISSIDPLRFLIIQVLSRRLHSSEGLLIEDIKESISGIFSKKIIDQFVSKFYIVVGLALGILLFFINTIPETPFTQLNFSNFTMNQLPTVFLQVIMFLAIIGVIKKGIYEFKNDQVTLENLTIFELYRMPLPFGYEWINDPSRRVDERRKSLKSRRPTIKALEQYLDRYDYRSFNRAMNVELIDLISSKTILNIKNLLGPTESTEIRSSTDWLDLVIEFPEKINETHNLGANCLSALFYHIVESLNSVASRISMYNEELEDFKSFVKKLKDWSYLQIPIDLLGVKPNKIGSSTKYQRPMNDIDITLIKDSTESNEQVFYYIFNLFRKLNRSTKYQELAGKPNPIEFIFELTGAELQFRSVNFSTKGHGYTVTFGEWLQWIINRNLRLEYLKLDFDETHTTDKLINLVSSINTDITDQVIFDDINESFTTVLSKVFQEEWLDHKLLLDYPSILDYLQKIKNILKEIEFSITDLKREFNVFQLKNES
ncbi:MAG: hypothetical protein HeimC2_24120 [Candidatus Heimdallarchaeota archaeon LC_2]|nr:MAG: hypothetical protein HeimC2_24120 [Candidatus Heimdallarchaeota archaeon LC_2]